MGDTRSVTRGPVPIALGSAAIGTDEGREFFQARLALFGGWVFLVSGSFHAVYFLLTPGTGPLIDVAGIPIGDPTRYHLYGTLVAGALWVVARRRRRLSTRALGWLDAISALLMCAFVALQWWATFKTDRRDGSAVPPLPATSPQTITVDVLQRVTR